MNKAEYIGLELIDIEDIKSTQREYDLQLFHQDMADSRRDRYIRCCRMLRAINRMIKNELARRIKLNIKSQ